MKRVQHNTMRARILAYVRAHPSASSREIASHVDEENASAQATLSALVRLELLYRSEYRDIKGHRYFVSEVEMLSWEILREQGDASVRESCGENSNLGDRILVLLRETPGMTIEEISVQMEDSSRKVRGSLDYMGKRELVFRAGSGGGGKRGTGYRYFTARRDMLVWELELRCGEEIL